MEFKPGKTRSFVERIHKEELVPVIFIVSIGLFLRFFKLAHQSLWLDELYSVTISNPGKSLGAVIGGCVNDVHPPLFQILLYFHFKLFGYGEMAARILPAVIGGISLIAVYFLGRAFKGHRLGLMALLITATNYAHIYYSQEVRAYALMFLLTCLSFYYFMQMHSAGERTRSAAVKYSIFTGLLLYTHYFGMAVLGSQIVFFVFRAEGGKIVKERLLAFGSIVLLYLPWLIPMLGHLHITKTWIPSPEPEFFGQYFTFYFNQYHLALFFQFAVLVYFIKLFLDRTAVDPRDEMLVSWLLVGLAIPYFFSLFKMPILTARNSLIILPALILMIGATLSEPRSTPIRYFAAGFVLVFSVLGLFHDSHYYSWTHKQQWRKAALAIIARGDYNAEDTLVLSTEPELLGFYFQNFGKKADIYPVDVLTPGLMNRKKRIYLFQHSIRPCPEPVLDRIETQFPQNRMLKFLWTTVFVFTR